MLKLFTKHPHSVGETYLQHFLFASGFGLRMLGGGLACLVHAVFPFLCQKTGSTLLLKMTSHFVSRQPVIEGQVLDLSKLLATKNKGVINENTNAFSHLPKIRENEV